MLLQSQLQGVAIIGSLGYALFVVCMHSKMIYDVEFLGVHFTEL